MIRFNPNPYITFKYFNFRVDNVYKTAQDNDKIKNVPGIAKVVLKSSR